MPYPKDNYIFLEFIGEFNGNLTIKYSENKVISSLCHHYYPSGQNRRKSSL